MKSPLSSLPPTKLRDLPRTFILGELGKYYGSNPPDQAVEVDYSLWRCAETGLEFAWPMRPGNAEFYEWVSQFPSYYPGIRWEYGQVRRLIGEIGSSPKILDVGCGKGDFLRLLDGVSVTDKYALDMNEPAVTACRQLGFHSFCGTMETAAQAGFIAPGQFPAVTSFHCLEHVEDPVSFCRSMLALVAPGGRLFVSTPYSPMSFESDWFDVMNHPPHHMTRWNLQAYQKLADLLGVKMRWSAPPSSVRRRALAEFKLHRYPPHRPIPKPKLLADLILNFPEFLRLYRRQSRRGRDDGGIPADVILVEFIKP